MRALNSQRSASQVLGLKVHGPASLALFSFSYLNVGESSVPVSGLDPLELELDISGYLVSARAPHAPNG